MQAAARAGDTITAVKLLREQGVDLRTAKERVEAWLANPGAAAAPVLAPELSSSSQPHNERFSRHAGFPLRAQTALRAGQMIEAIKIVREAEGLGLKEAKDRVDAWVATQPDLQAHLNERGRATRVGLVLLIAVFVAGLGAFLSIVKP